MKFGRSERRSTATEPTRTQDEQRIRRRQGLGNHLVGTWRLDTEIADVLGPLALDVTTLRDPRAMRRTIEEIGEAVAAVVHVAAALVAESRAADGQTRRAAADLAVKPRLPSINDDQITGGIWVEEFVLYAGEIAGDLADLLGRTLPPEHPGLRGDPSASERVERALREEFDRAVRDLERRIPEVQKRQALPSIEEYNQQQREQVERQRVDRAMARMGLPS